MPISTAVPAMIARGNVRCASRASPAEKVTYCHPSYAHSTPIIASPTPESRPGVNDSGQTCTPPENPVPRVNNAALITRMAIVFSPVLQFCTLEPWRVPRTFTAAITTITSTAITFDIVGVTVMNCPR